MSKIDIKDKIDNALFNIYNVAADAALILNRPARSLIKKNTHYKNKHNGETCFILGTGPSLKRLSNQQLKHISTSTCFGVNSFYKTEAASTISPKYYTMIDNLYWENWSGCFLEVAQKFDPAPPVFITDPRAFKFSEDANPSLQNIYIYSKKYPVNKMSSDIDTGIFAAMNVISYSILTAMYMGFKEINLLGCDYNAFCTCGNGHAYDDKSEVVQSNYNLAFYLKFYHLTTEFHYLIAKLAKKKGVAVNNLTPGSLLDAYPRSELPSFAAVT